MGKWKKKEKNARQISKVTVTYVVQLPNFENRKVIKRDKQIQ